MTRGDGDRPLRQRATLLVYGQDEAPREIVVQINPTDYTITRGAHYAEVAVPGLNEPVLQFVRGDNSSLSVELFLDQTDAREGIESLLVELRRTVQVDGDLHAPPIVELTWGETRFRGVVTRLQERFLLFGRDGKAQRARVELQLKSYSAPEEQLANPRRQSPDRTRTWVVSEGDRLDQIAARAYGDPAQWRAIASANDITRTLDLAPGLVLVLPAL